MCKCRLERRRCRRGTANVAVHARLPRRAVNCVSSCRPHQVVEVHMYKHSPQRPLRPMHRLPRLPHHRPALPGSPRQRRAGLAQHALCQVTVAVKVKLFDTAESAVCRVRWRGKELPMSIARQSTAPRSRSGRRE